MFIKYLDSTFSLEKPTTSNTENLGEIDYDMCAWFF